MDDNVEATVAVVAAIQSVEEGLCRLMMMRYREAVVYVRVGHVEDVFILEDFYENPEETRDVSARPKHELPP